MRIPVSTYRLQFNRDFRFVDAIGIVDYLHDLGITDVDVLKIDVDGPDFRILNSFDGLFRKLGIIATRMEVNMYGGPDPTAHLFHNTDQIGRAHV